MTDRQRQLIDAYLPNPPDPTLGDEEFYVLDTADRVRRVQVREILPRGWEEVTYGVYEVSTGNRIDAGWGNPWVGFHRGGMGGWIREGGEKAVWGR